VPAKLSNLSPTSSLNITKVHILLFTGQTFVNGLSFRLAAALVVAVIYSASFGQNNIRLYCLYHWGGIFRILEVGFTHSQSHVSRLTRRTNVKFEFEFIKLSANIFDGFSKRADSQRSPKHHSGLRLEWP